MSNMPKLKPIVMQMRVSAEDGARIRQAALRDNRTVSAWLRDVALRALDEQNAPARARRPRTQSKGRLGLV